MKQSLLFIPMLALAACSHSVSSEPMVGGEQDAHGCLPSTGASYSFLLKKCIQPFNEAAIKLQDPNHSTAAIYVVLSEDKQQAEVFAIDLPENTILEASKGGYASADGKIKLLNRPKGWTIRLP